MYVTYKFWAELQDLYKGCVTGDGAKNYCLTMDRDAARKLYQELKKEFG